MISAVRGAIDKQGLKIRTAKQSVSSRSFGESTTKLISDGVTDLAMELSMIWQFDFLMGLTRRGISDAFLDKAYPKEFQLLLKNLEKILDFDLMVIAVSVAAVRVSAFVKYLPTSGTPVII